MTAHGKAESAPVERKVTWSTLGAFAASLGVALLVYLGADPDAFGAMPTWGVALLAALGPTAVAFLGGFAAPHTARTDPAALAAARRRS